ncbi:unnamed protein product [Amoebophrya sp. A25]|nr:unnamed protein product [Amoebophrya sp. A25]|eukprot:GSA25T00020235001.1
MVDEQQRHGLSQESLLLGRGEAPSCGRGDPSVSSGTLPFCITSLRLRPPPPLWKLCSLQLRPPPWEFTTTLSRGGLQAPLLEDCKHPIWRIATTVYLLDASSR